MILVGVNGRRYDVRYYELKKENGENQNTRSYASPETPRLTGKDRIELGREIHDRMQKKKEEQNTPGLPS